METSLTPAGRDAPEQIVRIDQVFNQFKKMLAEISALRHAFVEEAVSILPPSVNGCHGMFRLDEDAFEAEYQAKCGAVIDELCQIASREFAPVGSHLDVSRDRVAGLFQVDRGENWRQSSFKPDLNVMDVWAALDARFGNGQGAIVAYRQAGKALFSALRLRYDDAMVRVGGNVDVQVWCRLERKYSDKYEISYDSTRGLHALCASLGGFMAWAGMPPLPMMRAWHSGLEALRRECPPRASLVASPFKLTFFKDKAVLRMSAETADRLSEFLSEYAEEVA